MENNTEKALDNFINAPQAEEVKPKAQPLESTVNTKKVILDEREGLIERVDRIYVTKEGKQLLREVY